MLILTECKKSALCEPLFCHPSLVIQHLWSFRQTPGSHISPEWTHKPPISPSPLRTLEIQLLIHFQPLKTNVTAYYFLQTIDPPMIACVFIYVSHHQDSNRENDIIVQRNHGVNGASSLRSVMNTFMWHRWFLVEHLQYCIVTHFSWSDVFTSHFRCCSHVHTGRLTCVFIFTPHSWISPSLQFILWVNAKILRCSLPVFQPDLYALALLTLESVHLAWPWTDLFT